MIDNVLNIGIYEISDAYVVVFFSLNHFVTGTYDYSGQIFFLVGMRLGSNSCIL